MARPRRDRRVTLVLRWSGAPAPLDAFRAVAARPRPFFRWAAAGPSDLARWSYLACDPRRTLAIRGTRRGLARDPFAALSSVWPDPVPVGGRPAPPFAGGWAGALSYECRAAVERIPPPRAPADGFPALFLARYDAVLAWDARRAGALVCGTGSSPAAARAAAARLRARVEAGLARRAPAAAPAGPRARRTRLRAATSPAAYRGRVASVIARIRRGDLFQANVSQRFSTRAREAPPVLFERMAAASPAPFLTYVGVGPSRAILSASPERFLSLTGRSAETRPMKGTRPRGRTPARDRRLGRELLRSVKDRAELAMIVDLARNDLSRSCEPGTVVVARARRLERYATVHQAVGVVVGRLARGVSGADLLRGAFPPGSVTGAPKVEAMKAIDELEGEARGPYCGAVGWFDDRGDCDLAVAIRTVWVADGVACYRVGGGVTLLSEPEAERVETMVKGRALAAALAGGRA